MPADMTQKQFDRMLEGLRSDEMLTAFSPRGPSPTIPEPTKEQFERLVQSLRDPELLDAFSPRAPQPTIHYPTIWSGLGNAVFSISRGLRNVAQFALIAGTTAALITAERHRNER